MDASVSALTATSTSLATNTPPPCVALASPSPVRACRRQPASFARFHSVSGIPRGSHSGLARSSLTWRTSANAGGGGSCARSFRRPPAISCALATPPDPAPFEGPAKALGGTPVTPAGERNSGEGNTKTLDDLFDSEVKSRDQFVWEKNWYPVALIEDLDPSRPTSFQLLGRDLVIWRDSQGIWRAHADRCPHRLAPLSEGRLDENGLLQCPYNGWSFRGDGSCAVIPQASDTGPESRACSSSRACVASYPALVSQGLLFVWPEEGRWEDALAVEPPRLPDVFEDEGFSSVTIQRDLYYGFDTLMENVSDPSHIEFAHHKVTGRRDRAKPLPFTITSSGPFGFAATTDTGTPATSTPAKSTDTRTHDTTPAGDGSTAQISSWFMAPCSFFSRIDLYPIIPVIGRQHWQLWICSFNVPMGPGKTRSIVCSARNFARLTVPGGKWWQLYPRWLEHLTSNLIYDGDMIVLQGQEKVLKGGEGEEEGGGVPYSKLTYTPAAADRMVLAFRNWLRRYGGGEPAWDPSLTAGPGGAAPLPSTVLSRKEMLDRLGQHTEKCSSCRAALKNVRRLAAVLAGAAAVLLAAAAVVPGEMVGFGGKAGLAVGAVVLLASAAWLKYELEPQFVHRDYVHADVE
ncbi:unnamed protein product [Closterium sp. Naga37s-1]|nr:unnamed protein product [Closterium sp. Naga37s-1]